MKLREIFRFEFVYQARRIETWLYFAVLLVVAYLLTEGGINSARNSSILANSPYGVAVTTVICITLWMLMAPTVAGSAAARDVQTRMHPLVYTTPVSKADYLGGRFLAAFVLNALILLMVPAGIVLALLVPGAEPGILGPFRPAAYLSAYVVLTLPTAFTVTAIQFSLAALNRRAAVSYLGSVLLLVAVSIGAGAVISLLQTPTLGKLLDPFGYIIILGVLSKTWTPIEKNTLLVGMQGSMLANRVPWISIGLGVLAFTYLRFRFGHHTAEASWWTRLRATRVGRRGQSQKTRTPVPRVRRSALREGGFGFATHARQTCAIAWTSFGTIAKSGAGLVLLAPIAILVGLWMPELMNLGGVPLLPRTAQVIAHLTAPVADNPHFPWVLIPLLIVFYAGELIWRERDAGLSEIADTMPVPEWVFFLGKFLGLSLVLVVWMALLTTAGGLGQMRMGYFGFEIGLYLRILFGLQLIDYLLFALLVFVVHAVVNQKHVGYLVALIAYGFIAFASRLGIEHKLLVYASDPSWTYTNMRGFGTSLGPWLLSPSIWLPLHRSTPEPSLLTGGLLACSRTGTPLPDLHPGAAAPARRDFATDLRGAFRVAWLQEQLRRSLRRRKHRLLHKSGLVAGHRLSVEPRAQCSGSAKTVWTRPTARLPIARRRRGAPDPRRRRPDHLRSDRGYERGSDRRCAGGAPPHVDGGRETLLPLPHGCTHQQ